MPQGAVRILREDLENPGQWESDNFAFEFKNYAAVMAGDPISSSPVVTQGPTPTGATALTIGATQAAVISGTQVIVSITLPAGSLSGFTYTLSCKVTTAAGKVLVQPGTLYAEGCG